MIPPRLSDSLEHRDVVEPDRRRTRCSMNAFASAQVTGHDQRAPSAGDSRLDDDDAIIDQRSPIESLWSRPVSAFDCRPLANVDFSEPHRLGAFAHSFGERFGRITVAA